MLAWLLCRHTTWNPRLPSQHSVHILASRSQWAFDTSLIRSISSKCPVYREISDGCSKVQCVNPVMSKHLHYCSWQIWQLLSSNTELQLHLKGVWIETDYLRSASELSLLSPQCNLLLFDGAGSNSGSSRQSLKKPKNGKTIPANVAVQAAFLRKMFHYMWAGLRLSTWKSKNAGKRIEKKWNGKWVRKVGRGSGFHLRAADIFMHRRDENFYSAAAVQQQSLLFQVMCVGSVWIMDCI